MLENRTTEELIRVAAAGGGFRLSASSRTTEDLIRIAAAGSTKRSPLIFTGLGNRTTEELIRIGAAGQGCVTFDNA